jgi:uncharacterized small protein (DUF1192 family)
MSVGATPPRDGRRERSATDGAPRYEYGLIAVISGLVVLAVLDIVAIVAFHGDGAERVVGLIGAISTPIGAIVAAYFGIKAGTQAGETGRADAERARRQASRQAIAFAAALDPVRGPDTVRRFVPILDEIDQGTLDPAALPTPVRPEAATTSTAGPDEASLARMTELERRIDELRRQIDDVTKE